MSVDKKGASWRQPESELLRLPRAVWRALQHTRGRLAKKIKRLTLRARWAARSRKKANTSANVATVLDRTGVSVINLAHRKERLAEFRLEMERIEVKEWQRVEAVDGGEIFPKIDRFFSASIGCTLSHIAALEQADWREKDAWMVCEDDAQFLTDRDELSRILAAFINDASLDVLALYGRARGASHRIESGLRISQGIVGRVCYVVKPHMKQVLIDEFSAGVPRLLKGIRRGKGDQMWRKLQRSRYFFATPARTMVQNRAGYSDIEGRILGAR